MEKATVVVDTCNNRSSLEKSNIVVSDLVLIDSYRRFIVVGG